MKSPFCPIKPLLTGALALAGVFFLPSVNAEDGTGTATATVIDPIAIGDSTTDLAFGKLTSSGSAGTVVITPASGRSATGGATLFATGSVHSAAVFAVTGSHDETYAITLPSTDQTITEILVGTATMTVNTFTSTPSGTGTLSGATPGTETVNVGATLQVGASQVAGDYTGTFTVTVEYN